MIVPYLNPDDQRRYQREYLAKRRSQWLEENGPCVRCGSSASLEVDHRDPTTKIDHKVWSWAKARREKELAKCQVLCGRCHRLKSDLERRAEHGTRSRYEWGCRCPRCRRANADYIRAWRDSRAVVS